MDGSDVQLLNSSTDCASALAAHFASILTKDQACVTSLSPTATTQLDSPDCISEDVCKLLASLDGRKLAGPDGSHPLILNSLWVIMSPSVTGLFNRLLSNGSMPSDWKCSAVKSTPKDGDARKVDNYRPICLMAVLARTLVKNMKKSLL